MIRRLTNDGPISKLWLKMLNVKRHLTVLTFFNLRNLLLKSKEKLSQPAVSPKQYSF